MKIKSLGLAVMLATLLPVQEAAAANVVTFKCEALEVATFQNRVHLLCRLEDAWPMYFAVPTSSSAEAQRLLTMGNAALVAGSGKYFWVTYDADDVQGASYGCLPSNCRRPIGLGFRK